VLWSGMLPPDVDLEVNASKWKEVHIHQVIGNADPYYDDSRWMEAQTPFAQQNLHVEDLRFDGVHEIRPTELEIVYDRIASLTPKLS